MKLTKSKLKKMIQKEMTESDFPTTTKKGKTVTVVHKTSGKELVIVDTPSAIKKYKRMGYLVNEYSYGVGDVVKDINPTCPHHGAIGKVKSVNPKSVIFVVTNKGKNYDPGDVLDKTHDQMKKESINEAGIFDDYHQLNPAYMDKFIKNYKKLNSKNLVKKSGGDVYGFRKGEREAHWKYDDDYKLHYDIDKAKALGLINFFNRAKKDHPWG